MNKLIYILACLLTFNAVAQYPGPPMAVPELVRTMKMGDLKDANGVTLKEFATNFTTEVGLLSFTVKSPGVLREVSVFFDGEHGNPVSLSNLFILPMTSCDFFDASSYAYPSIQTSLGDAALNTGAVTATAFGKHWKIEEDKLAFSLYGWYVIIMTDPVAASGRINVTIKESLDVRADVTELFDTYTFKEKKLKSDAYDTSKTFTASCDQSQVDPATGSTYIGKVTITSDGQTLESSKIYFDVRHNLPNVTKITLHLGVAADPLNASPLVTLKNTGMKFREYIDNVDLANTIYNQVVNQGTAPPSMDMFFVFHTKQFPNGEIRGQFTEDQD